MSRIPLIFVCRECSSVRLSIGTWNVGLRVEQIQVRVVLIAESLTISNLFSVFNNWNKLLIVLPCFQVPVEKEGLPKDLPPKPRHQFTPVTPPTSRDSSPSNNNSADQQTRTSKRKQFYPWYFGNGGQTICASRRTWSKQTDSFRSFMYWSLSMCRYISSSGNIAMISVPCRNVCFRALES